MAMKALIHMTVEEIENRILETSTDLGNANIALSVASGNLAKAHREKNKAFDAVKLLQQDMHLYLTELEKRQ